ncbi:TRAP transporter small permease [Pseudodesulfovibrio piezophilus]|uniref:Putative Tripartite ATP-independent periplasmic transporter, DctQ component n=1 Tax=Pseudodesulfovibrio piezophilus (strain DSM 21447 / JCM 15486 / C1TLV30) TaxID=1322246 RepID=M1WMQ9_PSEP2|nr:TRAP transporter small permease [Pseudodesulfovibrio piezophilus]CCH49895.1 putative Tripartite ATP-independent periplasmic transporter, DctQ component [Pseudodesulfovibrio piezophilus C1TLV30]
MIDRLDRLSECLAKALTFLAGVFLVCMMLLACANMVFRAMWAPIQGTFELMGFMGAVVAAFSLAFSQRQKSHIAVGLLLNRFPQAVQRMTDALTSLISCLFFIFCGLETTKWAAFLVQTGELSETLQIIYHPFVFATATGCFALSFVLCVDTLKILTARKVQ